MRKFTSITQFAEYLAKLEPIGEEHKIAALEAIGKYVKEKAQSKFGIYQNAVGEFPAWAPLKDATQDARERKGYEPNNPLFVTGEVAFSIDIDVKPNRLIVGSANEILAWQEFGTHTIPPRPVLGPAMLESLPEIKKILTTMMVNWLTGAKKYKVNSE